LLWRYWPPVAAFQLLTSNVNLITDHTDFTDLHRNAAYVSFLFYGQPKTLPKDKYGVLGIQVIRNRIGKQVAYLN
jgi:hypothetical protein